MSLSLSELMARRVPLEWFESVALTQAVCATALEYSNGSDCPIPDPEHLLLTPDGRVRFSGPGAYGDPPVAKAGRLLKTLLPDNVPVPLRLFALTALSSEPHASLREFSEALQYYERPDGEVLLRNVHGRALETPAVTVVDLEQPGEEEGSALATFPTEAPASAEPRAPASLGRSTWPPRWLAAAFGRYALPRPQWLAAAFLPILVVAWGGWRYWSQPAAAEQVTRPHFQVALPDTTPTTAPAPAADVGGAAALDNLPVAAPPVPAEVRAAAPLPVVRPRSAWKARGPLASSGLDPELRERDGGMPTRPSAPVPTAASPRPAPPAAGSPPPAARSGGPIAAAPELVYATFCAPWDPTVPEAGTIVYTAADKNVVPPVPLRSWFWTEPPREFPVDALLRIEVLVSGSGDPVSARVAAGPPGYIDGMILSAVKGGKFRPAVKAGCPVAYRQSIWVRAR